MADTGRSTRTAAEVLFTVADATMFLRTTRTAAEALYTIADATISVRNSRIVLEALYVESPQALSGKRMRTTSGGQPSFFTTPEMQTGG